MQLNTIHDIAKTIGVDYEDVFSTIQLIGERPSHSELVLFYNVKQVKIIKQAVYHDKFITVASKMNEKYDPKKETLTQFINRWSIDD
jgi:hypothetical protein